MGGPRGLSFEERLERSVVVTDCWLWERARDPKGYGKVRQGDRTMLAHRWVYERLVGPVPDGLHLDHLCRVPSCVNPDHLEPVTNKVNAERGSQDWSAGPCKHGHPHSLRHTAPSGQSYCKQCRANYKARRAAS